MRVCWLLCGVLGGCSLYEPGALLREPRADWAQSRTVGCVDVSIQAILDPRVPANSVVLDVALGNRCERPVPVDLSRLVVSAQWPGDPAPRPMEAFDPHHEIRLQTLPLLQEVREGIQFELLSELPSAPLSAPAGALPGPLAAPPAKSPAGPPSQVCVAFGKLVPGQKEPAPACFSRVRRSMVPSPQESR